MHFYRPLAPIKAMTFDLDDTLYDNHPVIEKLSGKFCNLFVNLIYVLLNLIMTISMRIDRSYSNKTPIFIMM